MEKCKGNGEVVKMFLIKCSDIKTYEPNIKMKRKYGKFKRTINEIDLKKK